MRAARFLVVALLFAPAAADAQTTTADGIQALTRGDYAVAIRILRPLAEDSAQPDPLALFFMAGLYASGRGVAPNTILACGLYLRAATPTNPLQTQSLALARMIHREQPAMLQLCMAASEASWRGLPTASFTLGQDHQVQIDQAGVVVVYQGERKTTSFIGGPGWVFLPVRHTQLDVSVPVAARRHFIEFLFWLPDPVSAPREWGLRWMVFEVVGADLRAVTVDGRLADVSGAAPPTNTMAEEMARLRVNANGEAEWIVSGLNPRSGLLPYLGSR